MLVCSIVPVAMPRSCSARAVTGVIDIVVQRVPIPVAGSRSEQQVNATRTAAGVGIVTPPVRVAIANVKENKKKK